MDALFGSAFGPLFIFLLRIVDVSLATLRMLMIMRGHKRIAPLIGFFEVLIWIFAVGNAIRYLHSPLHLIGYAGGFAMGNLVGVWIEEKMALGMAAVRVVSQQRGPEIAGALRGAGFGVTQLAGHGRSGDVEVLYAVLRRRDVPAALRQIDVRDPAAFVTIEEPRAIHRGWLFEKRRK